MNTFNKIVIICLIFAAFTALGCTGSSNDYSPTDSLSYSAPETTEYCEYDMTWFKQKSIGYQTAPSGYTYAVCTLYVKNYADKPISTYVGDWKFVANGVIYDHDSVTYSDVISYNSVDVTRGGEFETQFVYMISDTISNGYLVYDEYGAPEMRGIKHYKTLQDTIEEEHRAINEKESSILSKLQSKGYAITYVTYDDPTMYVALESLKDVEEMFDICAVVYVMSDVNYFVVYVDGSPEQEFRTTISDVRRYAQRDLKYEDMSTVEFPDGTVVTYSDLSKKLDDLLEE